MSATTLDRPEIEIPELRDVSDHTASSASVGEARSPLSGRAPSVKRRRNTLLMTVSAAAVVVVAAASITVITRHHAHHTLPIQEAPHPLVSHAPAVATSASLARAPLPTPAKPIPAVPSDGGDDMEAFLRAGGHETARPDASSQAVISPDKPQAVAVSSVPPHGAVAPPQSVATVASPVPSSPQTVGHTLAPSISSPPVAQDAADIAARVVPGKMTDSEQIQVLDLVTKLGTLVRDQNLKIAELQGAVAGLQGRVQTSLADFGRRLTLAEATGAVSSATAPSTEAAPVTVSAPFTAFHPTPARSTGQQGGQTAPQAPATDSGPHRYHVQAASPGLAMLAELDTSGADETQVPVSPGDTLPGFGKIISITQRGSAWVVKAQNGVIQ